jgi:very-short-patch-repair endonuclease
VVSPELMMAARTLRREETPAEAALWQVLRDRGLDRLRFRRQHAVGRFVLDFYCPALRLAVEVDGGEHDTSEQVERDQARTEHLAAMGYTVVRVRNQEVLHDLPTVLARLKSVLEQKR